MSPHVVTHRTFPRGIRRSSSTRQEAATPRRESPLAAGFLALVVIFTVAAGVEALRPSRSPVVTFEHIFYPVHLEGASPPTPIAGTLVLPQLPARESRRTGTVRLEVSLGTDGVPDRVRAVEMPAGVSG